MAEIEIFSLVAMAPEIFKSHQGRPLVHQRSITILNLRFLCVEMAEIHVQVTCLVAIVTKTSMAANSRND